ncbi:nucleotidyltransferase family protein [Thalassiella azotivora]
MAVAEHLTVLREAAASGALARLCHDHDVTLLVVFGSAVDPEAVDPRDLDVAVRFTPYRPEHVLTFLDRLAELAGTGAVDLMVLNTAGPVAREQALVFGEPLYERGDGDAAREQIAATMERLDTDHLRRAQLELLRSGG